MDQQNEHGENYVLRYMGCVAINTSMKLLEFDVRKVLTKECITRVCEAAKVISMRKRKVDKKVQSYLPGPPNLEYSGENVYLTISTRHIVVTRWSQPQILFDHQLGDISFTSIGDEQYAPDFVGYVGKDDRFGRRCYVFECGDKTLEVFSTIGDAFTTRFEQVTSTPVTTVSVRGIHQHPDEESTNTIRRRRPSPPNPPPRVVLAPRSPVLIDLEQSPSRPPAHPYVNASDSGSVVPSLPCLQNLSTEPWFHGRLSREESEALIKRDDEFMVRISTKDPNQVVLTGMQNGVHKHLMLIDDEGKVRTKDREFDSVSHLIEHHRTSHLPITSTESAILLQFPVTRDT